jgi:DNA replication protein DnaC
MLTCYFFKKISYANQALLNINASLIITTNRKIKTWAEIFFDPVMANAALDRIVNNFYMIVLEGNSYIKNFTHKFKIEDKKVQQKS